MKKYFSFFITATLLLSSGLAYSEETKVSSAKPASSKKEIAKISEAFGHLIAKNLESIGVPLDIQAVVKGLKDSAAGKNSPMTEVECIQAITSAQESVFAEIAKNNLIKAEEFLQKNQTQKEIISCAEGQVQYKIEKEGTGEALKEGDSPLIQYSGKFLDGSVFSSSKEPESFPLDDVIPGLRAGLLGMKEGEKRTLFIHPNQAYGTSGSLPPNSLLTFEVELLKTQAPVVLESTCPEGQCSTEIALPDQPLEHVR